MEDERVIYRVFDMSNPTKGKAYFMNNKFKAIGKDSVIDKLFKLYALKTAYINDNGDLLTEDGIKKTWGNYNSIG